MRKGSPANENLKLCSKHAKEAGKQRFQNSHLFHTADHVTVRQFAISLMIWDRTLFYCMRLDVMNTNNIHCAKDNGYADSGGESSSTRW